MKIGSCKPDLDTYFPLLDMNNIPAGCKSGFPHNREDLLGRIIIRSLRLFTHIQANVAFY